MDEDDIINRLGKIEDILYTEDGTELIPIDRLKELVETNVTNTAELAEYKKTGLTAKEFEESCDFNLRLNKAIKQATGKTALDWERMINELEELRQIQLLKLDQFVSKVDMSITGPVAKLFMARLIKMFEDAGATNFFTVTVDFEEHHYGITVQKADGKLTPEEKITDLTEQIDVLRGTLALMRFAYLNKDADCPHGFEIAALTKTERILGKRVKDGMQND